jgi:hypothetical protein
MTEEKAPNYRWAAWSHWANLAFLASAGVAGATVDPILWALALPVEALIVWLLPDLRVFRAAVDQAGEGATLLAERAYYLAQLWGLGPPRRRALSARVASLFVARDVDDLDERIQRRPHDAEKYLEMRQILQGLRAMVPLARTRVTQRDVLLLENVVNGYLRLLLACRPIGRALSALEQAGVGADLAEVHERLETADATLRPVLLEQKRLLETQLARVPKLRATLQLLRARAEALPHQLRNLHGQLLTEPAFEVHGVLEEMLERNELLSDPLEELKSDASVRELLEPTRTGSFARKQHGREASQ